MFTADVLRIVNAEVPRRLLLLRDRKTLLSTSVAVLVGGGGATGGGAEARGLGSVRQIIILFFWC